jgi:hypothetical protein
MMRAALALLCVFVFSGCSNASTGEDPGLDVSGPISCLEAVSPGSTQLAFCVENWGLTVAAAHAQAAACVADQSDAGVAGLFSPADGPCPLDSAVGGCIEARTSPVVVVKWWYAGSDANQIAIDCHGNPEVAPPSE